MEGSRKHLRRSGLGLRDSRVLGGCVVGKRFDREQCVQVGLRKGSKE